MLRWERTAPPDNHQSFLDGRSVRNTQISRFAYVISKIAIGEERKVFPILERHALRADGRSYISRDASWMKEPYQVVKDWALRGLLQP
jgi:hypothetical protein